MKVYAFYTESHKILLNNWFLPSIKKEYLAELDIVKFEQKCPLARLNESGWVETMHFKIDTIMKGISDNIDKPNNIFIHSDIDIQFFGNFIEDCTNIFEQQDCDILFQKGGRSICMGFFICRANSKTKKFFTDIKKKMIKNHKHDEYNAKSLLNIPHDYKELKVYKPNLFKNSYSLIWNYLPIDKYINGEHVSKSSANEIFIPPPHTTIMHHATSTLGIKNKIKQLKYVNKYLHNLKI